MRKYSMFGMLGTPEKVDGLGRGVKESHRSEQKNGGGVDAGRCSDPWEVSLIRDNTPTQKIVCNYGFEQPSSSERSRFEATPTK